MSRSRTLTAAGVSAALAFTLAAPIAAVAAPAVVDTIDYLGATYDLPADHIVETVTYERFEYLLNQEGSFVFIVGGPEAISDEIVEVNEAAQAAGVPAVYNFNPALDGRAGLPADETFDIRTSTVVKRAGNQTRPEELVSILWDNLVDNYLSKDADEDQRFGDIETDPQLFVYNKDRTVEVDEEDVEDRIVAAVGAIEEGDEGEYREAVEAALDLPEGLTYGTSTQFEFYSEQTNARHAATYADETRYGGAIFDESDEEGFTLQSITYPELEHLLASDGNFLIFFGGTWCHNTRAVIKQINAEAKEQGVGTVYQFDLRLDGNSSDTLHVRDTISYFADRYGQLVDEYLPNLVTQYRLDKTAGQRVDYYADGDRTNELSAARKLQVPYIIEYNKDNKDALNQPAPVVREWIQNNNDGTYREFMTEWWYTLGLRGGRASIEAAANDIAFAAQAVAAIEPFFTGVTSGTATAPKHADVPFPPAASVADDAVTVTWTAPRVNGSAITGYQVTLGSPVVATAEVAADATSHTFTGVAAGDYVAQVAAVTGVGTTAASDASNAVTVEAVDGGDTDVPGAPVAPVAPSVTAALQKATVRFRAANAVTVTVGNPAAVGGTVQVKVGSRVLPAATVAANRTARVALPANLAVGTHAVTATFTPKAGDATLTAATSTAVQLKVNKAKTKVKVKSPKKIKASKRAKITVTVKAQGPAKSLVAKGKVVVKVGKKKVGNAKLKKGKATIKLKKLARGKGKITVTYKGNKNFANAKKNAKVRVVK